MTRREGDFSARESRVLINLEITPKKSVVLEGSNDVFFWKGAGSPPSRKSARHTRPAENSQQKVSAVQSASFPANT